MWPISLILWRSVLLLLLLQKLLRRGRWVHLRLLWVARVLVLHVHRRHRLGVLRLGHWSLLLVLRLLVLLRVARLCLRVKIRPLGQVISCTRAVKLLGFDSLRRSNRRLLHHRIHWVHRMQLVLRVLLMLLLLVVQGCQLLGSHHVLGRMHLGVTMLGWGPLLLLLLRRVMDHRRASNLRWRRRRRRLFVHGVFIHFTSHNASLGETLVVIGSRLRLIHNLRHRHGWDPIVVRRASNLVPWARHAVQLLGTFFLRHNVNHRQRRLVAGRGGAAEARLDHLRRLWLLLKLYRVVRRVHAGRFGVTLLGLLLLLLSLLLRLLLLRLLLLGRLLLSLLLSLLLTRRSSSSSKGPHPSMVTPRCILPST